MWPFRKREPFELGALGARIEELELALAFKDNTIDGLDRQLDGWRSAFDVCAEHRNDARAHASLVEGQLAEAEKQIAELKREIAWLTNHPQDISARVQGQPRGMAIYPPWSHDLEGTGA